MVMSMFRINVARSDSFITACPVARRHHLSWGMACRGRQPSIPCAQQRVFAVKTPVLQNSCIWKTKNRKETSPCQLQSNLGTLFKHRKHSSGKSYIAMETQNQSHVSFKETTDLFETEGSSSFFVCVTKVPLFFTLSFHVWWSFNHIALKQTNETNPVRIAQVIIYAFRL